MMKLYDAHVSGNCYKVRLMLSLLNIKCEPRTISLPDREQKTPDFLAMNPIGKIPVLDDNGIILRDSQAILIYLAKKYGTSDWWPDDAEGQAEIMQWLSFAANEMFNGCAISRAILKFKRDLDLTGAQNLAKAALGILEGRLKDNDWLASDHPTIADIAVYPYAALVWEGGISLTPYPAIQNWFKRIEALPNYIVMEGLPSPL